MRESIVSLARGAAGGASRPSIKPNGAVWANDTAGGDGARMRAAIQVWHDWRAKKPAERESEADLDQEDGRSLR